VAIESIKKWVLKPYFWIGSRVNDPAFLGLVLGFLIRPAELAPGFLCSPNSRLPAQIRK
jgi:hypothetical protein